jgi:hypothetical protein
MHRLLTLTTGMCCGCCVLLLLGSNSAPFSPSVTITLSQEPATASSCCGDQVSVSTSDRKSDTRGPKPSCNKRRGRLHGHWGEQVTLGYLTADPAVDD